MSVTQIDDTQLQAAFEACTLPREDWTHRAHVRMAYIYASQHSLPNALQRMRRSIQAYNASQNTPYELNRGYHETITVAFMRLVCDLLERKDRFDNSADFCNRQPQLLEKRVLLKYYSRERIMSWEAKREFIEPDLMALPDVNGDQTMAYDEYLAARIRDCLLRQTGISERQMFGGIAFLLNGNMLVGVAGESLIARVGADDYGSALEVPHAQEFDLTGRPMHGWILVQPTGIEEDPQLDAWIGRAMKFVSTLPAK